MNSNAGCRQRVTEPGDRIVANIPGYVGKSGKVIGQSEVTLALTVQLDGVAHELILMPYEVQREEFWKQTHPKYTRQ